MLHNYSFPNQMRERKIIGFYFSFLNFFLHYPNMPKRKKYLIEAKIKIKYFFFNIKSNKFDACLTCPMTEL